MAGNSSVSDVTVFKTNNHLNMSQLSATLSTPLNYDTSIKSNEEIVDVYDEDLASDVSLRYPVEQFPEEVVWTNTWNIFHLGMN